MQEAKSTLIKAAHLFFCIKNYVFPTFIPIFALQTENSRYVAHISKQPIFWLFLLFVRRGAIACAQIEH